jgi:hypothetical protein
VSGGIDGRAGQSARIDRNPGGTQALVNLPLQCQFDAVVVKASGGKHPLRVCAVKGTDSEQDVFGFNGG